MSASPQSRINYLRLSITDRCNLRCVYCTYWRDWEKVASSEILRYEELLRIARVAASAGITKVRVTGGEPLVRRGVVELIRNLHQVPGIQEVCLTTNGIRLQELAAPLFDAGLNRVNVSLDTLNRERYRHITGGDHLTEVLAGLAQATAVGMHPIKINCVAMKGINDDELRNLAQLARHSPYQVRFIELMPTVDWEWWQQHYLPLTEIRRRLEPLGRFAPVKPGATDGPARTFRVQGFAGELGFISPMSGHHCNSCNRLRVTAMGKLRPCLFEDSEIDLKSVLRDTSSENHLFKLFRSAIAKKLLHRRKSDSTVIRGEGLSMAATGG
jgi:cyclic pyranopterin phosphate synthase